MRNAAQLILLAKSEAISSELADSEKDRWEALQMLEGCLASTLSKNLHRSDTPEAKHTM